MSLSWDGVESAENGTKRTVDIRGQYLLDPMHPHLFALNTDDPATFVSFVHNVGVSEFLEWAVEHIGIESWVDMFERFQGDSSIFTDEDLTAAWTKPEAAAAVSQQLEPLLDAYQAARDAARIR